MMEHLVSAYIRANMIAHVQSTNGSVWLRDIEERDENQIIIPMRRVNLILAPTVEEIERGENGKPVHRKAAELFQKELEFTDGKVRYRIGLPQFGEEIQEIGEVRDGRAI